MDNTAIELIQHTALDAARALVPDELKLRLAAIPSGYKLEDLERFLPNRYRFRGAMATNVLADFVGYVKDNDAGRAGNPSKPMGFIDADTLSAKMFFNLVDTSDGMPGHADWTATLNLKKTAGYAALLAINGKPHNQQQMVDWLEDWGDYLTANGVEMSQAIAAVRKVTITAKRESEGTVGNFKVEASVLDQVEAKSSVGLPDGFTFSVIPYVGLASRTFALQLRILTSGDKPSLVLRITALEVQQEAIAQEFKKALFEELGESAALYIGAFTP